MQSQAHAGTNKAQAQTQAETQTQAQIQEQWKQTRFLSVTEDTPNVFSPTPLGEYRWFLP